MATKVSGVGRGTVHPAVFDKPVDEGQPLETPLAARRPPDHPTQSARAMEQRVAEPHDVSCTSVTPHRRAETNGWLSPKYVFVGAAPHPPPKGPAPLSPAGSAAPARPPAKHARRSIHTGNRAIAFLISPYCLITLCHYHQYAPRHPPPTVYTPLNSRAGSQGAAPEPRVWGGGPPHKTHHTNHTPHLIEIVETKLVDTFQPIVGLPLYWYTAILSVY